VPVLERTDEHRLGHPVEQVADDVVHQPLPGRVVEHLADQRAGLTPVVVLGVLSTGIPASVVVGGSWLFVTVVPPGGARNGLDSTIDRPERCRRPDLERD
jgi:hypothetical protein